MIKKLITSKKFWIILWLVLYVIAGGVLISESLMPGDISAQHSNVVGGGLGDIINTVGGDQSEIINPTSIELQNEDKTVYIGDTEELKYSVFPDESSFKTVIFESSNNEIASVNKDGLVNFLKAGEVTITVKLEYDTTLLDSVTYIVIEKAPTSFTSFITKENSNNELEKTNGIYTLIENNSYLIRNIFEPIDSTLTNLTYTVLEPNYQNYFTIKDNLITVIDSSNDKVFTIEIKTENNLVNNIKIKCTSNEINIIPLTSISVNQKQYVFPVGFTLNLSSNQYVGLVFTPNNATYKDFTLTSENEDVATINNKTIKTISYGESLITIKSRNYPEISATFTIKVEEIPIEDFEIYSSGGNLLITGKTYNLNVRNITPELNSASYGNKNDYFFYSSSNTNVIEFTRNNGSFTCKSAGEATLTLSILKSLNGDTKLYVTKSLRVNVSNSKEVNDFTFNTNFENLKNVNILKANKSYNLKNNITFASLLHENATIYDLTNYNTTLHFYYENTEINTLILEDNKDHNLEIRIYPYLNRNDFYLSKIITLHVFYDINSINLSNGGNLTYKNQIINIDNKKYFLYGEVNLDVYENLTGIINSKSEQIFSVSILNSSNSDLIFNYTDSTKSFNVRGEKAGTYYLVISPFIDLTDFVYILKINVSDVILTKLNIKFELNGSNLTYETIKEGDKEIITLGNRTQKTDTSAVPLSVNNILEFSFIYDKNPTKTEYFYEIDNQIITINQPNIYLNKEGVVNITIREKYSELSLNIRLFITNIIKLNETNPYSITRNGQHNGKIEYIQEINTFNITKGFSYSIKLNFTEDSTYKNAIYSSSNEEIVYIGQNGTFSALNNGESEISVAIDDEISQGVSINFKINVVNALITDSISNFFLLVRKGLGHFGAFLCFGICSTLFYMLVSDKKDWIFMIPINFLQGLTIASFTELCQSWVPGRGPTFNDVLIDFSGFMASAVIITLIFIIIELVKYLKNKSKITKDGE